MTFVLHGLGVSRGIAIGRAVRLDDSHYEVPRRQISECDRAAECERLDHATAAVHHEFDLFERHIPADAPTEISALLGVHAMILDDPALTEKPRALILERGMNAEWALAETADDLMAVFEAMDDAYLRERKHDVMQVVGRLRKALAGVSNTTPQADELQSDALRVLVANDLAPADMLQFRATGQGDAQRSTVAFCTEVGGRTSHTAILARSMNVPAVVGVQEASVWIKDGDWLIIDGEAGAVIVAPDEAVLPPTARAWTNNAPRSMPCRASACVLLSRATVARSVSKRTSNSRTTPAPRCRPMPPPWDCSAPSSCS
jgi:phosphotransferase system enzyme I (PtsI)